MYSQKTYSMTERAQPNYTLNDDGSIEVGNCPCPSQFLGMLQEQFWTSGACHDVPVRQDILGFVKSSGNTTLLSRFESPTSAFYATERCMRFPQYGSPRPSGDPEFSLYRSTCENFSISSGSYQSCQQDKLQTDHGALLWRPVSVPKENQDCKLVVACNSNNYPMSQPSFASQPEGFPLRLSSGSTNFGSSTGEFPVSVATAVPNKTRIRWTQDLHEKFVESVNRLGGAEKATPKAILKLMDSDRLTIFHIKSHLQKYRIAKYIPDSVEGKSEKKTIIDEVPRYDLKGGLHIKEALQLQLDVQRQLLEQLEIQRKLQVQIEEQGKQLRMMFDQQQKTTKASMSSQNEMVHEEDDHFPGAQGSENTRFPSKIS